MENVVHAFERHVREHPYQWFQFRPFWDERDGARVRSGA